MASLAECVKSGLSDEQKCDILYQLLDRALEDGNMPADAYAISVDSDNTILWQEQETDRQMQHNATLWPPEMIQAMRDGRTVELGQNQKFYIAGMLGYFISNGRDWFEDHDMASVNVEGYANRPNVIQESEVRWPGFEEVIAQLSATDPELRDGKNRNFVQTAYTRFPSVNELIFQCDGSEVFRKSVHLREDMTLTGKTLMLNGVQFQTAGEKTISARPGTHSYRIEVSRIAAPPLEIYVSKAYITGMGADQRELKFVFNTAQTTTMALRFKYCVGPKQTPSPMFVVYERNGDHLTVRNRIVVKKPDQYSQTDYWIRFFYTQGSDCFETVLLDLEERTIGNRQKHLLSAT